MATSYGALLALAVALRAPFQIASLVLAEPPLHPWVRGTEAGEQLYSAFIEGPWHTAAEMFARSQPQRAMQLLTGGIWGSPMLYSWSDDRIDAVMRNAAAMQPLTRAQVPFPDFKRSAVSRLPMLTLLRQGQHTSPRHRQVMTELGKVMRDAKRIEIPHAGHGSPDENPDAFNAAVAVFLGSLLSRSGVI